MIRRFAQSLLTAFAILFVATMNAHASNVLTHHVREAARTGQAPAIGRLPRIR